MKLISEKYQKLKPHIDYLSDEVVITQAWKKTHSYMRTYNWYADTLALDISALGLEGNAKSWARAVKSGEFKLYPIELVPAAKSEHWRVDPTMGWIPSTASDKRKTKPPIRPLAHLTIRDQTWATTLMMCLADVVETAQGNCGEKDFQVAQKLEVYSYGNRLLCEWNHKNAWFRWGNAETYRKFFTDYQNFLRRPIEIGRLSSQDKDDVYVINLDLEKFYDKIDRNILLDRLKQLSVEYGYDDICPMFWQAAERLTSWEWDSEAINVAKNIGLHLGTGLPQGLVASGFFANAYMTYFDRAIGKQIGSNITNNTNLILKDYCRYVDDIRIVVAIKNSDINNAASEIFEWVTSLLNKHAGPSLTLNQEKFKITSLSDLDNRGSLSGRIQLLQNELSGPTDRDTLENVAAVLEGLLTVQTEEMPELSNLENDRELIRLVKFDHDIRPDTLKRFAANRLELIMRNKRKLTPNVDTKNQNIDELTDNESELLSKKLIRAWMHDPSLGLVLRKAIEIFPSPRIAEPVFDAVFSRSSIGSKSNDIHTAAVMDYLLADLFRSCVDFNGFFQKVEYPKSASPEELFNVAVLYAQKVALHPKAASFIKRQALLLLAVLQKTVSVNQNEGNIQLDLHIILSKQLPALNRQRLALFEIAAQITGQDEDFASLVINFVDPLPIEEKYQALEEFAKRGGPFWTHIWKCLHKNNSSKSLTSRFAWAAPEPIQDPKSVNEYLSRVISSNKNGFEHEAALIKLGIGLINLAIEKKELLPLSPKEILVRINPVGNWSELWRPKVQHIACSSPSKSSTQDPRFTFPEWIENSSPDSKCIYWIGTILRAAAIGSSDYTGSKWKLGAIQNYKGLRSGWYKRRMGMMHSSEVLVGEYATVSNWFCDLLMTCLQWPGFEATHIHYQDIKSIQNLETLRLVLVSRLEQLDALYCRASNMPTLVTNVKRPGLHYRKGFRIVSVQQILPRAKDFEADPTLDSPSRRSEGRDHLSRIAHLTHLTLQAKLNADGDDSEVGADLIVFPEISVHLDDQDILKRLADKTKSIILAGLVFHDHKGQLVNIARWFIPDYRDSGRQWIIRDQGKANMTDEEIELGISGYRPCQHIIEISGAPDGPFRLSGAICYDATDLELATDLKDKTDLFIVCAHNKDVGTFDTMIAALNYHMYQHVALVNKGEYGGSTLQAPYREHYERLISHAHGSDQISIAVADLELAAFRPPYSTTKDVKKKPANTQH